MAKVKEAKKASGKGRKPITYQKEDLEREPMVLLVCGETGVGKSYRNKQEIKWYMMDNPAAGKVGRKVLAFDTNDDDFPEFRTVSPDHIKALTRVDARRIRPFNRDGSAMAHEQKREVVEKVLKHYKNGLIVLDDIDDYMAGAKGQSMIGALCTSRHKGIDILLIHQSLAKISTTEWQNCYWLRMHHQIDDLHRIKDRVPKYKMVRIAQLIVDEQYELAVRAYDERRIDKDEFKKRKSFFVYVNMREQKVVGCSQAAFIRAARKYIDQEENSKVRMMMNERSWKKADLVYKDRNEAVVKLISDYLRFHDLGNFNPF